MGRISFFFLAIFRSKWNVNRFWLVSSLCHILGSPPVRSSTRWRQRDARFIPYAFLAVCTNGATIDNSPRRMGVMRSEDGFQRTLVGRFGHYSFFPFANVISNMHICSETLLAKIHSLLAASFCLFTASSIPTGFGNLDKFNGCLYGRRRWLCAHAVWLWVIHNLKFHGICIPHRQLITHTSSVI